MSPLFVITRDDPADDRLHAQALAAGFAVAREALLATEPGADSPRLAEYLAELPEETGLAWTSRRAAEALVGSLPRERSRLARVPMYAVGEESALPVRAAGLSPLHPPEPLGAAVLAQFIAERAGADHVRRILFLHGNRALPDLPDGLRERGLEVRFLEVYRTRFLNPEFVGLDGALQNGAAIIAAFFSPSGVEAFERLLYTKPRAALRERATAIARGSVTAAALHKHGYRNVIGYEPDAPFSSYAQKALEATSGGPR